MTQAQHPVEPNAMFRFHDDGQTRISLAGIRYASKVEVDEVIDILQDNRNIRSIDLNKVNMAPQWLASVIDAAASCPNLEEIDLSGNDLHGKGMQSLVTALPNWPKLKKVLCDDCYLVAGDVKQLCNGLQGKPVETLSLRGNKPGGSLADVAQLMETTPEMRGVFLSNCAVNDAGFRLMANTVLRQDHITDCELYYNTISDNLKEEFASALTENHNRNLVTSPIPYPALDEVCNANRDVTKRLIGELKGIDTKNPDFCGLDSATLAAMHTRLSALETLTSPRELAIALGDFMTTLPNASPTHTGLFEADARGFTPLDNPETWQNIGTIAAQLAQEGTPLTTADLLQPCRDGKPYVMAALAGTPETVLPALNEQGIRVPVSALIDNKSPTPLLAQMIMDKTAPLLFSPQNCRGEQPDAVRALFNALPSEQQDHVPHYHALVASLGKDAQSGRGR